MEFKASPPYAFVWGYCTTQTMGIILIHHNHRWCKSQYVPPIHTQVFVIIYIHHASIYNPFSLFVAIAFLLHLLVNFKFHVKPSPNHLYNKTRTLIIMKTTTISKVEQKKLCKKHNKDDATKSTNNVHFIKMFSYTMNFS